jgi:hypothetical protein
MEFETEKYNRVTYEVGYASFTFLSGSSTLVMEVKLTLKEEYANSSHKISRYKERIHIPFDSILWGSVSEAVRTGFWFITLLAVMPRVFISSKSNLFPSFPPAR